MRRRDLRLRLSLAYRRLRAALRQWSGDEDYERYCQRCAAQRRVPLDRGRYFAERLEARYRGAARCC